MKCSQQSVSLAFIPARGGSVGIPNKNIALLNNLPMICYTIKSALESEISSVVISSDSKEILKISREYVEDRYHDRLCDVIFHHRSGKTSTSTSSIREAILEFIVDNPIDISYLLILQPTSPIRLVSHLNETLGLLGAGDYTSVVSVCEVSQHPREMIRIESDTRSGHFILDHNPDGQRQSYEKVYFINGSIYGYSFNHYLLEPGIVLKKNFFFIMSRVYSVDVDSQIDFDYAEYLMGKNQSL